MALYVPAGARRRRVILALLGGIVLGLVAGYLVGRASAPGLADEVADVQDLATDAATSLLRIPIEYEQSVAGEGGESTETITAALDRAQAQLAEAYAAAIWLPDDASAGTDASFDELVTLVEEGVSPGELEAAIDELVTQIERTFAISAEAAG